MHLVNAWTSLPPGDLLLMLAALAIAAVTAFIPGRGIARVAAMALGLVMPFTGELGTLAIRWGWCALFLLVAVIVGRSREIEWRRDVPRPGGLESGMVGLVLGLGLMLIPITAIARQELSDEQTRWASAGLAYLCIGLLHLMLRRDGVRAVLGFAVIGLGLQWLDRAVRAAVLEASGVPAGLVLAGTVAAIVLAARTAAVRRQDAGTTWVSHAHDLHD